jgi:small-conductance mechanosensitive channel
LLLRGRPELGSEKRLPRQLALFAFAGIGATLFVAVLPVAESIRGQMLTLSGLVISAIVALSSTTLIGNAMASMMIRLNKSFRTGDFIRVAEHFGRVTERGLFHTEIQTEDRELTALPNLYLASHPVSVVRSSGTIVSATLSLGYDVPHEKIERLLIEAAGEIGLEEPFVRFVGLGDFSITYRVSGLLVDIKALLSARSNLQRQILDTLHGNGVEIVSPTFMNQRRLPDDARILPVEEAQRSTPVQQSRPEDLLFDKAEEAEQAELQVKNLASEIEALGKQLKQAEGDDRTSIEAQIQGKKENLAELETEPEPQARAAG